MPNILSVVALAGFAVATSAITSCRPVTPDGGALCFNNQQYTDILPIMLTKPQPDEIGLDKCAVECNQRSYTHVGVRGGSRPLCFCGNSVGSAAVASGGCNSACPVRDSSGLPCGGEGVLMSVYKVECGEAKPPGGLDKVMIVIIILAVILIIYASIVTVNVAVLRAESWDRFSPLTLGRLCSKNERDAYSSA